MSGGPFVPTCPGCGQTMHPVLDQRPATGGGPLPAEVPIHFECPTCGPLPEPAAEVPGD